MKFCVPSICQPGEIMTVLGQFFPLMKLFYLWQNIRVWYLKWKPGATLTVLVQRDVWTLQVSFMVKNESDEGINKEPVLLEFYIGITFRDVQATLTLKKSNSDWVWALDPSHPHNLVGLAWFPFWPLQLPLCKANLQLAAACLHTNPSVSSVLGSGYGLLSFSSTMSQRPVPCTIFYWFTSYISELDWYF